MLKIDYQTLNKSRIHYDAWDFSSMVIHALGEQYQQATGILPTDLYICLDVFAEFTSLTGQSLTPMVINNNVINIMQTIYGPIKIHLMSKHDVKIAKSPILFGRPEDFEILILDEVVERELLL